MSEWTPEEIKQREAIMVEALNATAEYLQQQIPYLEPTAAALVEAQLSKALAILRQEAPTEAMDLLTCATYLQIVEDMIGGIRMNEDPLTYGLELCRLGAAAAIARMKEGGYPRPTQEQHKLLITGLRKQASALVDSGKSVAAAIQDVQNFARKAVLIVMGEPPVPAPLVN